MTEPKRATWREFAAFMAARCSWPTTEATAMWRAVPLLRSKRDAQIAYAAAYGYGDEDFERDVTAWFDALGSQGIEPPADPPSVAEALESVAANLELAANVPLVSGVSDYFRALDIGEANGYAQSAIILRGKAKEFT